MTKDVDSDLIYLSFTLLLIYAKNEKKWQTDLAQVCWHSWLVSQHKFSNTFNHMNLFFYGYFSFYKRTYYADHEDTLPQFITEVEIAVEVQQLI